MSDWIALAGLFITIELTLIAGIAWIYNQFGNIRNLVYTKINEVLDKISEKMEYHERHDDKRFSELKDDLWTIKMRNAAKDGYVQRSNFDQKEDETGSHGRDSTRKTAGSGIITREVY